MFVDTQFVAPLGSAAKAKPAPSAKAVRISVGSRGSSGSRFLSKPWSIATA